MKYLKKKKKSVRPWLLLGLVVLLAVLILVATRLTGGNPTPGSATDAPAVQGGDAQPGAVKDPQGAASENVGAQSPESPLETERPKVEGMEIETPYATLVFPGDWSGLIQVDQIDGDPYQVVFTAKLDSGIVQELFTVSFGGGMEDAIGVVQVSGKDVPVHLSVVDFEPGSDWTDNEISTVYALRECLNDVLVSLNLASPQEAPEDAETTLPPEDSQLMAIDTPAGELYYPARWKDYLKLEVRQEDAYVLEFYASLEGFDPVQLFNVCLDGDAGIYVTDVNAPDGSRVKLSVEFFEIEPDINWTDAQKVIVLAMQEDINVLLAELN